MMNKDKENIADHVPVKTLQKMIDIAEGHGEEHLTKKLREAAQLTDYDKMNRWLGYYQHYGQALNLWTLDQVIQWVRDEKKNRD